MGELEVFMLMWDWFYPSNKNDKNEEVKDITHNEDSESLEHMTAEEWNKNYITKPTENQSTEIKSWETL